MKSYRSDAERNIWHGAAEGWETSGRAHLDPCGFPGPRRVPRVAQVAAAVVVVGTAFLLWFMACGCDGTEPVYVPPPQSDAPTCRTLQESCGMNADCCSYPDGLARCVWPPDGGARCVPTCLETTDCPLGAVCVEDSLHGHVCLTP